MKKLIAVALVIAMFLPMAALAETDPIVGCWYMNIDLKQYPELKSTYGNFDQIIDIYVFDESGNISGLEAIITDGTSTPTFTGVGKWEKNLFGYNVNLIGLGQSTMTVNGNEAYLKSKTFNISMKFRRLVNFDPYNDYVY